MNINWHREIPTPLAVCLALAVYAFIIAAGTWWFTR